MQTLKDIIEIRQSKHTKNQSHTKSEYWLGYYKGWFEAYKDLLEILNRYNLDPSSIVVINKEDI